MALSVIEFQDPTGEIMVARVPFEGTEEFVTGSELIVQESQFAVFFRDGRPTDGFKSGRHTLSTQNLPVISKLVKLASFGRRSPFRAYLYFVHRKTFVNLGWGTPTPIMFRDSEFKAVHLRANGMFSLRVGNPAVFVGTILGTQALETTHAIEEFVRRIIVSRFARLLPTILKSILDLPLHYEEIEVGLKKEVHDDLEQYGLEVVDLVVEAITVPPEVQKMIDRAAGSRALDDSEIHRYQSMAISDALRDSGEKPEGAGMIGAIGIGAGIGMAQQLAGGGSAPAGGPPPVSPALHWYAAIGGEQAGPFSLQQMVSKIQSGEIARETLVWKQGMADWVAAEQAPDLSKLFASGPPPLPPVK